MTFGRWTWISFSGIFLSLLAYSLYINDPVWRFFPILILTLFIAGYWLLFQKDNLLALTYFLIPLSVSYMDISEQLGAIVLPSEIIVVLLAAMTCFYMLFKQEFYKKVLKHPLTLLLIVDVCWLIVASAASTMNWVSYKRVIIRVLYLLVFYFLSVHWFRKEKNLPKVFILYMLGLIYPVVHFIKKLSGYDFDLRTVFELSKPFYDDHTIFGASIAFILPAAFLLVMYASALQFSSRQKIMAVFLLVVLLVGEFVAYSRAAWISLFVSFCFYVILRWNVRFWQVTAMILTLVFAFFAFRGRLYDMAAKNDAVSNKGKTGEHIMSVTNVSTDASNMERINRWMSAIRMAEDKPLTGFGPGTYQFQYAPYQAMDDITPISTMHGNKGNAHSEPLTYLSESGFPGLIFFLLWSLGALYYGMKTYYRVSSPWVKYAALSALLGYTTFLVHGLVNSFLDQVKMASLVFVCMAVFVAIDVFHKNRSDGQAA